MFEISDKIFVIPIKMFVISYKMFAISTQMFIFSKIVLRFIWKLVYLAALFVELWKRRQAMVAWKWDLEMDDAEEQTRPEFEVSCTFISTNRSIISSLPLLYFWKLLFYLAFKRKIMLALIWMYHKKTVYTSFSFLFRFPNRPKREKGNTFLPFLITNLP